MKASTSHPKNLKKITVLVIFQLQLGEDEYFKMVKISIAFVAYGWLNMSFFKATMSYSNMVIIDLQVDNNALLLT